MADEKVSQEALELLCEAITEHFGERCPDFEPDCLCCRTWARLDALLAAERERDELRGMVGSNPAQEVLILHHQLAAERRAHEATELRLRKLLRRAYNAAMKPEWEDGECWNEVAADVKWEGEDSFEARDFEAE